MHYDDIKAESTSPKFEVSYVLLSQKRFFFFVSDTPILFYLSPYISYQAETGFTCRDTMTLTFMHWCPKTIQDFFLMKMIIQSDKDMDQFVLKLLS
jgi:hypothetical protein